MFSSRITLPLVCHAAGLCKALRMPSKADDGFYLSGFADPELSTCLQVCEKHELTCDLSNLPWKKGKEDKDMKKQIGNMKEGGKSYDCKGAKSSKNGAAPMIALDDASDIKGECFYPEAKDFDDIDCDAKAPAGYRRLCYCTKAEEQAAEEQATDYDPMWPEALRYPGGRDAAHSNRYEACLCYAKKGEHGATAIPPEFIVHEDGEQDQGGYHGECAEYCDTHELGPFHSADAHLQMDWTTKRPAIIVMHGSGGSKDEKWTTEMSEKFADAGFVVMAIAYNDNTCVEDVGNAVEYLRTVAAAGVDPDSVALYGWSFGGRCVYRAGYEHLTRPDQTVKAVIDMSGCGGKGPLNNIKKSTTVRPPALLLGHAENDKTISIKECEDLVAHSKTKSWDDDGKKGDVIINAKYFTEGGHNLLSHKKTAPVIEDEIFNHLFMYLGRPCRTNAKEGLMGKKPVDGAWPQCKQTTGESTEKCGGVYDDVSKISPSCNYP